LREFCIFVNAQCLFEQRAIEWVAICPVRYRGKQRAETSYLVGICHEAIFPGAAPGLCLLSFGAKHQAGKLYIPSVRRSVRTMRNAESAFIAEIDYFA